ncbi:hypothetical protein [Acrocarpospora pleiomorpha]|uniref:hypothetical protein n=1 Tax=Acrocarpospora pleiomorpha TaxID=90975 RepID=UPI0012D2CD80|nr:hypothetical protein [Acrocarpospora pleiomorpha]
MTTTSRGQAGGWNGEHAVTAAPSPQGKSPGGVTRTPRRGDAPSAAADPKAAAWWIVPITLVVGGGVAWWLLSAGWTAAQATATQGALQTALATGAGVGAVITFMLAFRRQRHQEHAAHITAYLAERNADLADRNAMGNLD